MGGADQIAEARVDDDPHVARVRAAPSGERLSAERRVGLGDRAPLPRGVVLRRERVEAEPLVQGRREEALEVAADEIVARRVRVVKVAAQRLPRFAVILAAVILAELLLEMVERLQPGVGLVAVERERLRDLPPRRRGVSRWCPR